LELGVWGFSGSWILDLGSWILDLGSFEQECADKDAGGPLAARWNMERKITVSLHITHRQHEPATRILAKNGSTPRLLTGTPAPN
jgi:hypothetical protein